MTVLSYQSIMATRPILDPEPRTEVVLNGVKTTYGCGPAGYDLRLDTIHRGWRSTPSESVWIEPGEFLLASAQEQFQMPAHLLGVVHDKSSWARRGLAVQNTVIEPGWRGFLTLELTNHSRAPLRLTRGVGICQVIFHRLDEETVAPYEGKYQDQSRGAQEAK